MTHYRPSVVADIRLMFDPKLHIVPDAPVGSTDSALKGADKPSPFVTPPKTSIPLVSLSGDDDASFLYGRVPRSAQWDRPGHRQAGKFSLTFDFRDMPIDPRTVRSAAVEIHSGCVSDEDFAKGMRKLDDSARIKTKGAFGPNLATLRISGLIDEWHVSHGEDGSEVSISGRDYRGVLLDTMISTDAKKADQFLSELDLSLPIDLVVIQILELNPFFDQFMVKVLPAEWPDGVVPSPGAADTAPYHRLGAKGKRKGAHATPPGSSGKTSFWDIIVRTCYLCGAIPFFVGNELHIRPSAGLYAQLGSKGNPMSPTPFKDGKGRTVDLATGQPIDGPPLLVRRLVYGRDIKSVSFDRKFGGFHRPGTIRVTNVDASSPSRGIERTISAIWPPDSAPDAQVSKVAPSNKQAAQEFVEVPVSGITDVAQLQVIAQAVYEEIGRGEVGGSCETPNLSSFGGDNTDPDLLSLNPGDAVEFATDTRPLKSSAPLVSALTEHQRTSFEEQVRIVTAKLGDKNLARVVVATTRNQVAELQRFFRVQNVSFSWSVGDGLQASFNFQNFIEARNSVQEQKAVTGPVTTRRANSKKKKSSISDVLSDPEQF